MKLAVSSSRREEHKMKTGGNVGKKVSRREDNQLENVT